MVFAKKDVLWTLTDIRDTVRRLTGRLSTNRLGNDELDTYINRFYLQELPARLSLDAQKGIWKIETMAGVPTYGVPDHVVALDGQLWSDGSEMKYFTDPDVFWSLYRPQYSSGESLGSGDGATVAFSGTLNNTYVVGSDVVISDDQEILRSQNRLVITDISEANPAVVTTELAHGLATGDRVRFTAMTGGMSELEDIETTITVSTTTTFSLDNIDTSDATKYTPYVNGGIVVPVSKAVLVGDQGGSGTVTLSTGAYSVTFNSAPASGQAITASYEFSSVSQPQAALHYGGELKIYPTPSRTYHIMVAVQERPRALVAETDGLQNNDWGEYISYGAARRILFESGQIDQAQVYEPRFMEIQKQLGRQDIKNRHNSRAVPRF